jgi:hypothetical protein
MIGFFETGSHKLFAQAGFESVILLISAFQVARITCMSQQCLAKKELLFTVCGNVN